MVGVGGGGGQGLRQFYEFNKCGGKDAKALVKGVGGGGRSSRVSHTVLLEL